MFDTGTDVKTTVIYREACTHCNEITERKNYQGHFNFQNDAVSKLVKIKNKE